MKIFLGDLVHTWRKVSLWTFPLNAGYVGAYARQELPGDVEVRLFKRPETMIEAIRTERPDVVGLAHYVWNTNLNKLVFQVAKDNDPGVLTVGGGPNFTSANADEPHARAFFETTPGCDAYVVNQGERGFLELMRHLLACGGDVETLRERTVDGVMINDLKARDAVRIGPPIENIRDLDELPSPYLTGLMDEFFEEPFVPIIETNRSCPYRCTFCAWGIGTGKLARFSDQRIFDEIDYIGARCTKTMNLYIADANFSILERDAEIARRIHDSHVENGYPGHIIIQWNKTRPDRVMRVAKELKGLSEVGASMQSLNPDVLDAIKRRNLPLDDVAAMTRELSSDSDSAPFFSELIVGLPEETWQSHLEANRQLIDLGAHIVNYNLHILPGTEMDAAETREVYFKHTVFRLHDNAYGVYDGAHVFEAQEVVNETGTMSMDELRSFRFIHFLIQFMWSRKWYHDYLQLFCGEGLHPVDLVVRIAQAIREDGGEMGALYQRFSADHALETFETPEALAAYWSEPENLERLRCGDYGKLNFYYSTQILFELSEQFDGFLLTLSDQLIAELNPEDPVVLAHQCREVIDFGRQLRVGFSKSLDSVIKNKVRSFKYDLLAWRESGYDADLSRISTSDRFDYEFFLSSHQEQNIQRQLSQFRSTNPGLTFRKMSELIDADDFFYDVRTAPMPAAGGSG